ncbi:MAG: O-antigen ligase family protein [Bacteroidaceae bacterium]|nr:O-antigen ligase family protein [Bacteroidaceae bacterium]
MAISSILSIILISIIFLSFVNLKWGTALFLAYLLLIPYLRIEIAGFSLGENFIRLMQFVSYFFYALKYKIKSDWKPLFPFVIYFIVLLLIMPFQSSVPFSIMLDNWRQDFMKCLILPFILWNIIRNDHDSIRLYNIIIIIGIVVSIGYGLFLTSLGGVNPYAILMLGLTESTVDYESYYLAAGSGRLFGRISSVYFHPMDFAFFIGLAFIFVFYVRKKLNSIFLIFLLAAISLMAVVCGVRSVIGGLAVTVAYYFLMNRHNHKMIIIAISIGLLCYSIIMSIPDLSQYIGSIIDVNNENGSVKGSSIEMRMNQLQGTLDEMSQNPLFGLGYKWTSYYQLLRGDHPIILAFESLAYVVLCNSGIVGVFLWFYLVYKSFHYNKSKGFEDSYAINSLLVFYISYAMITGEYGYMKTYLFFYILMIGNSLSFKGCSIN